LLGAFLVMGLVVAFQLAVTLLYHTSWSGPATDWMRTALAWPELLIVVGLSLYFSRAHHPTTWSWWMWSVALLSYAIARTLWTIYDQLIYHNGVPFPTFPDLFFELQYPFFFLATIFLPRTSFWGSRLLLILDGVLVMGAATALSWHFILAPIYMSSGMTPLARSVSLAHPVGDLLVLFGLTMTLLRPSRYEADRLVLIVLVLAVMSLIIADSWVGWLLLSPPHKYMTGHGPDIFWVACYLLVPLAGLVKLRLAHSQATGTAKQQTSEQGYQWQDVITSVRFILPFAAALFASAVLLFQAEQLQPPIAIALGLLVLVMLRQGLLVQDNARLRREREQALQAATALMETFVGMAGHELKNPLANMKLALQLAKRRIGHGIQREPAAASTLERIWEQVTEAERQEERLNRLVNELLDVSRARVGKLELHLESTDLAALVREAVEEQAQVNPARILLLEVPGDLHVPITGDAQRLGQVVTNYLTNALKYSPEDGPVTVGIALEGQQARVWVRDAGPGLPPAEQPRIWERYHRVKGIEVQSGTGVGLGLGLYICRTIVERHHGQVGVQSTPGQGSTFWFTVLLAPPEH
jgi:signal transduction histidine kinase